MNTHEPKALNECKIKPNGPWSTRWMIASAVGIVGTLMLVYAGLDTSYHRFFFSFVFAYFVFLTVALGSLFFVILQRLTSANWSVTVRRTAEFFASGLPVLALWILVPLLVFSVGPKGCHLEQHRQSVDPIHYSPPRPLWPPIGETVEHSEHDNRPRIHDALVRPDPNDGSRHDKETRPDPNHVAHENTMERKAAWFEPTFLLGRALFYVLTWAILGRMFFRYSVKQDESKDIAWTLKAQRAAPVAMIFFALTLTFAAFDWVMALEPSWFSTIFGVYVFATAAVSSLAVLILVTMSLRDAGYLKDYVNVEHYHDLGKLLFGFNVFWAYIGFSQFMLIWYAALPEETTYYHLRWDSSANPDSGAGPWAVYSILLILLHFVVPFFLLLSRNVKRSLSKLKVAAAWLLVAHVLDWYWFVMPNFSHYNFEFSLFDVVCLMAIGGTYLTSVFLRMTKHPLIPVGDPRLKRALHFHNS